MIDALFFLDFLHNVKLQVALKSDAAGPNLDKKWVQLSDPAPSHKIFTKIYFVVKSFEKGLNRMW